MTLAATAIAVAASRFRRARRRGLGKPSILIVAAAPDDRRSSQELREWAGHLARRDDARSEVWFLRDYHGEAWPGTKVVDELRTWPVARLLEAVGLGRLADGLRGLRLRRWLACRSPNLVVFNDGLGERILDVSSYRPVRVARLNAEAPVDAELEAPGPGEFDAVLSTGFGIHPGGPVLEAAHRIRERTYQLVGESSETDVDALRAVRAQAGVPIGEPLILGWGEDAWIDGPDIFIRALWALEHRHGVTAHGLWVSPGELDEEEARLRAEAARCGVGERYHRDHRYRLADEDEPRGSAPFGLRACGDAILLPYRSPTDPFDVLDVLCSGLGVVTFGSIFIEDPQLRVVEYLDVDAAAAQLADLLQQDRAHELAAARDRLRLEDMLDELVSVARTGQPRT